MLKIKDNVDLKELEKFGFVYRKCYHNYIKLHSEKNYHDFVDNYIQIEKNGTIKPCVQLLDRHSEKKIDKNQAVVFLKELGVNVIAKLYKDDSFHCEKECLEEYDIGEIVMISEATLFIDDITPIIEKKETEME